MYSPGGLGIPWVTPTSSLGSLHPPQPPSPHTLSQQGQRGEVMLFDGRTYSGIVYGLDLEKGMLVVEYATVEVSVCVKY